MRRFVLLLLALTLFSAACGNDNDTITTDDGSAGDGQATTSNPGDDEPMGAGPYPIADLSITVHIDGAESDSITYRLACLGDTATLTGDPSPGAADAMCLALNSDPIRARLIDGPPADRMCTEIYGGPQVATITGTLDGSSVDSSVNRADGCGIDEWDRLLAVFLPVA